MTTRKERKSRPENGQHPARTNSECRPPHIAPDLFRVPESNTLTQGEVIQYVGMHLSYGNALEAVDAFNALSHEDNTNLRKEVFPESVNHWEPKP